MIYCDIIFRALSYYSKNKAQIKYCLFAVMGENKTNDNLSHQLSVRQIFKAEQLDQILNNQQANNSKYTKDYRVQMF